MRWSERAPAVGPRSLSLSPSPCKRRAPSVAVAHLVLVRWCDSTRTQQAGRHRENRANAVRCLFRAPRPCHDRVILRGSSRPAFFERLAHLGRSQLFHSHRHLHCFRLPLECCCVGCQPIRCRRLAYHRQHFARPISLDAHQFLFRCFTLPAIACHISCVETITLTVSDANHLTPRCSERLAVSAPHFP
jgi:hypothetical protein